jgi:tetratricopeptide (TPR) repeat protein
MAELRPALEMEPDFVFGKLTLALVLEAKERYREALEMLLPLREIAGAIPNYNGYLGLAYAKLGMREEAQSVLEKLFAQFPGRWAPGVDIAMIYNGLGDTTSALHWLERAGKQRSFDATYLRYDPRFANLRTDPAFLSMLERIGLVR